MTTRTKIIPKDMFGNTVRVGDKIMYITGETGHKILNWAVIEEVNWPDTPGSRFYTFRPYRIKASKYAEKNGWSKDLPKTVYLTRPHMFIVGQTIPEKP